MADKPFWHALAAWAPADQPLSYWKALSYGVPGFFEPNPLALLGPHMPWGADRAGYYSTAPLERTLLDLVDFSVINRGRPRLTVGAAHVRTSRMRYFDSRDGRGEALTAEQKERIFLFWDRCVAWGVTLEPPPAALFSELSLLSCYLTAIDERALRRLVAVTPFTSVNYNADRLIEELARLANTSPGAAA